MIAESEVATGTAPNFNALARIYRWMEWLSFGPCLSRCRREFLAQIRHSKRALVLGDGDGRFTSQLLRENPNVVVDAVDASPAMLAALLRQADENSARVRTHCTDARDWRSENQSYDLIVTHFFLDCLTTEEVRALARRIRNASQPDAVWIVSDFTVPENRFGQWIAAPLVSMLYTAFAVMTGLKVRRLPDHSAALQDAGFALKSRRTRLGGLLTSELWLRRLLQYSSIHSERPTPSLRQPTPAP